MGGVASSTTANSVDQSAQIIENESCSKSTVTYQEINSDITIENCKNTTINLTNDAVSVFSCCESQNASVVQATAQTADSTTKSGLFGVSTSDTSNASNTQVGIYLNQTCGTDSQAKQVISNAANCKNSNHIDINELNKYNTITACTLAQTAAANQQANQTAKSQTSNMDLSDIIMPLIILAVVIAVIIIAVLLIRFIFTKKQTGANVTVTPVSTATTGSTPAKASTAIKPKVTAPVKSSAAATATTAAKPPASSKFKSLFAPKKAKTAGTAPAPPPALPAAPTVVPPLSTK
jgi:hypothetical protein